MSRVPKTHFNCVVVGEAGSGKTVLCSILTNPERGEGYYFLDPDFGGANLRVNEEHGITFIDTCPLTSNERDNLNFLGKLKNDLRDRQTSITGWIFCIRYGRIKNESMNILKSIILFAQPCSVHVVISGCVHDPWYMKNYMLQHAVDTLRQCSTQISFSWYKASVTEEFDEYLGRWITLNERVREIRSELLDVYCRPKTLLNNNYSISNYNAVPLINILRPPQFTHDGRVFRVEFTPEGTSEVRQFTLNATQSQAQGKYEEIVKRISDAYGKGLRVLKIEMIGNNKMGSEIYRITIPQSSAGLEWSVNLPPEEGVGIAFSVVRYG